jgi:hypothetical protein
MAVLCAAAGVFVGSWRLAHGVAACCCACPPARVAVTAVVPIPHGPCFACVHARAHGTPPLSSGPTMMSKEARSLFLSGGGEAALKAWKVRA